MGKWKRSEQWQSTRGFPFSSDEYSPAQDAQLHTMRPYSKDELQVRRGRKSFEGPLHGVSRFSDRRNKLLLCLTVRLILSRLERTSSYRDDNHQVRVLTNVSCEALSYGSPPAAILFRSRFRREVIAWFSYIRAVSVPEGPESRALEPDSCMWNCRNEWHVSVPRAP